MAGHSDTPVAVSRTTRTSWRARGSRTTRARWAVRGSRRQSLLRRVRTTTTVLADLAETVVREEVRPPAIVVVGEVVALGDRLRS